MKKTTRHYYAIKAVWGHDHKIVLAFNSKAERDAYVTGHYFCETITAAEAYAIGINEGRL